MCDIEIGARVKIAIPSESGEGLSAVRSGHFGHAAYFTIVDYADNMSIASVESVPNVDHDTQGCGGVIDYVMSLGVDGILTAGMGMPPFTRFTAAGITVYVDGTEPIVGNVAKLFAEGRVERMSPEAVCSHHH